MYLLVLFFPFISFSISGLFGRFLGRSGVCIFANFCILISVCISIFIFYEIALSNSICHFKLFTWFQSGILNVTWGFLFDTLSSVMLLVVLIISSLVHLYSVNYMWSDPHIIRFMSYLSLFTLFMLILVTADNFVQMFVGWEGVGLVSYLLINFWYTRVEANKSSIKAILVNRIGDFTILIAFLFIFFLFLSLDYMIVFSTSFYFFDNNLIFNILNLNIDCLSIICFFIFFGAVGKSAQLGLHTWLPDAMEGPTPVSALIHAATMVTAGVFIILRCSPLFEYTFYILSFICFLGGFTAFFASTIGLFQNDLKKVIAYSTCSQLGYMVFICGLSGYQVSLFHLFNHAFFKALLFLSAGAVIHGLSDEQDMRKMGSLVYFMPFCYIMFLIGSLSLMGFPFLTGFYSKDIILELAFSGYTFHSFFVFWIGVISAFFTSFYSIRLICFTFLIKYNGFKKSIENSHDASFIMIFVLLILSFCSIFFGFLFKDLFLGLGTNFFNNSIFILPMHNLFINSEFIPYFIKLIPTFFSILGLIFSLFLYLFWFKFPYIDFFCNWVRGFKFIYLLINKKWFFDIFYNKIIVFNILKYGYLVSFKLIDRGFFEFIGPLGLIRFTNVLSNFILSLQKGFLYHYILNIFIGFLSFYILIYFFLFILCLN